MDSISIAVGTSDEIVHAGAYGLAGVATGRPATPETPYLLASVTKPKTATCVCLLAAGGSIDLDQPIDRYLGGVVPLPVIAGWRPTVRHVLQHRGGFRRFWRFFYADELDDVPAFTETPARYGHVFSPRGDRYDACVRTDLIACSPEACGDALRGTAHAEARLAEDSDRARRYGSSLSHPCELRRA